MKNQKASSHQKVLSLKNMSCAFVVLGFGSSLASFLVFLLELIYKRFKAHHYIESPPAAAPAVKRIMSSGKGVTKPVAVVER